MFETVKRAAQTVLPSSVWGRMRELSMRLDMARYSKRIVEHRYGSVSLRVHLADGLAEGWYDQDWPTPPEIDALVKHQLRPGARVFDIGAHQGVVAMMLADVAGPEGQVIAVEAIKHNVRMARLNGELNGMRQLVVIHAAAAAERGTVMMSMLNGQVDDGSGRFPGHRVTALTIDDLARTYGSPDIVVLDIEGFECHALRGARQTLAARPDWCVEVHVALGLEKFGSVDEVVSSFPAEDYTLRMRSEAMREFVPYEAAHAITRERFFLLAIARK